MTDAPAVRAATQNQLRAEALMEDLWRDPQFGPTLRAKAKAKYGDIATPEDIIKPLIDPAVEDLRKKQEDTQKALDELRAENKAREERDENARQLAEMRSQVDAAVMTFGLTEEGRAKLLDRMKETKAYDVEAAAAYVAHKTKPDLASGATWLPKKINLYGSAEADEAYKKLHTNPVDFLDDQIAECMNDPAKYVAETFGQAA